MHYLKTLLVILSIGTIFVFTNNLIFAQTAQEQLQKKEAEIRELENKVAELNKQGKTLALQITLMNNQIKLTELRIESTKQLIAKLEDDIILLGGKVEVLEKRLKEVSEILLARIVVSYKVGNVNAVQLVFTSNGFADYVSRAKYIQVAQEHDRKLLFEMEQTKRNYNNQKDVFKTKQDEQEKLAAQLESLSRDLAQQKKDKEELLKVTQNDEKRYQALIAQIRAEIASIAQAISNVGAKIGPVNKGDVIAGMGSTGCSTGPHLHFEIFENAKVESGRIIGDRTNPHNYLDNGKLGSPLSGYPDNTTITTEYGEVYKIFGFPSAHTGLDIAPKSYEGVGRSILAADKGIAYVVSAPCSYNISGGSSVGKGIIIDHQNGLVTLYWHIL